MAKETIRCAIYTRKSTEEGLGQEFNSLDAQREAGEAFIQSQKHSGWTLVSRHYDDGGFSGGSMERPALQSLLADIDGGRLDCVVVYKVDRLSRSLLDFARLMDRFDQKSVSFVSVTQQFNTTSSLGRLTLNVLLSFAQFEREIIAERTRDKMAAARRKGKWVGGVPVLGYDIDPAGGRLVINPREAERVSGIFDLYRKRQSLLPVVAELARRRWTTKSWTSQKGSFYPGRFFTPASLSRLLTNAVFAGRVEYRGGVYQGEQPAIVAQQIWEEVNAILRASRRSRPSTRHVAQNALLAGLLMCQSCRQPMVPTYTAKLGRRYRYYVCRSARRKGWAACQTKSVQAQMIEESVVEQLRIASSNLDLGAVDGNLHQQVRERVKEVSFDGATGNVALTLHSKADRHED
jgi:site-specific DNA recombinase